MHDEQFNDVFRSGGVGTGERKKKEEKEHVVEDIRNRSSHIGPPEGLFGRGIGNQRTTLGGLEVMLVK